MKKIILPATFLAALTSTSIAAPAETVTVDVELTETAKKDSETTSVTLTLADEGSCAKASSENGSLGYVLEVCRRRDDGGAPILTFEVDRVERGKKSTTSRHVDGSPNTCFLVSSKLAAGKRTVVGRITHGDDATEIAATVK